jgi:hypothetical protein
MYYSGERNAEKGLLLGYGAVAEHEVAPHFRILARVLQTHL